MAEAIRLWDENGDPVLVTLQVIRDLKHITCPQCHQPFTLSWGSYTYAKAVADTLLIRDCPSGGVYAVSIMCPHCAYEEEL